MNIKHVITLTLTLFEFRKKFSLIPLFNIPSQVKIVYTCGQLGLVGEAERRRDEGVLKGPAGDLDGVCHGDLYIYIYIYTYIYI